MRGKRISFDFILISIVIIIIIVAVGLFFYQSSQYKKFVYAEQPDICKTPPGYTDEQWREHMGHHPDRYAQCLK